MKLTINNFSKIKSADIEINGLTVIAGYNNTGKSTVGKILFSIFNAFYDIENKVRNERASTLATHIRFIINSVSRENSNRDHIRYNSCYKIAEKLVREYDNISSHDLAEKKESINRYIKDVIDYRSEDLIFDEQAYNEIADSMIDKVIRYLDIKNEDIEHEIVLNYFSKIFNNQINSLYDSEKAELILTIKGKNLHLNFDNNKAVSIDRDFNILHEALYIDNPFIVDKLSERRIILLNNTISVHDNLLENIKKAYESDVNPLDSILVKNKFSHIHNVLENALNVNIEKNDKGFFVNSEKFSAPMAINNLSTGLKAFAVLQILLEKNILKEKDVLVLDEPEVHLHPQWQLVYAELIVLLQKYFDLSIIMTTHSPYFLDAINLYSQKHGIEDNVTYYLSYTRDERAYLKNVSGNLESIYNLMAAPFDTLDTIRYTKGE